MTATHHSGGASAPLPPGVVGRVLAGRCADAAERGSGTRVHAVRGVHDSASVGALSLSGVALCGARPGRLSPGWGRPWHADEAVTCPRCLARLAKTRPSESRANPKPPLSPVQAATQWWDAIRSAPPLPAGCATEQSAQRSPYQADLFGSSALRVLGADEARTLRITTAVRLVALTLARFGARTVTVNLQAGPGDRIALFDDHTMTLATIRAALRVLLSRGFLRVEHGGRDEPNTYTLTMPEGTRPTPLKGTPA